MIETRSRSETPEGSGDGKLLKASRKMAVNGVDDAAKTGIKVIVVGAGV